MGKEKSPDYFALNQIKGKLIIGIWKVKNKF